jgi:Methylamine utilisation protein MauE
MQNRMALVIQLAIGLTFLLSVKGKLMDPRGFARGVIEYRVLPDRVSYLAGLLLIPAEMLIAATHLTGWFLSFGVLVGVVVLACFTAGVALNLKRGRLLPCYCFGNSKGSMISGRTLARLILLMIGESLLLAGFALSTANNSVSLNQVRDASELGFTLLSAIFLLILSNWLIDAADVVKLLRPWRIDVAGPSKSDSSLTQNISD